MDEECVRPTTLTNYTLSRIDTCSPCHYPLAVEFISIHTLHALFYAQPALHPIICKLMSLGPDLSRNRRQYSLRHGFCSLSPMNCFSLTVIRKRLLSSLSMWLNFSTLFLADFICLVLSTIVGSSQPLASRSTITLAGRILNAFVASIPPFHALFSTTPGVESPMPNVPMVSAVCVVCSNSSVAKIFSDLYKFQSVLTRSSSLLRQEHVTQAFPEAMVSYSHIVGFAFHINSVIIATVSARSDPASTSFNREMDDGVRGMFIPIMRDSSITPVPWNRRWYGEVYYPFSYLMLISPLKGTPVNHPKSESSSSDSLPSPSELWTKLALMSHALIPKLDQATSQDCSPREVQQVAQMLVRWERRWRVLEILRRSACTARMSSCSWLAQLIVVHHQ